MRILAVIFAFAFLLVAPSTDASVAHDQLPGVGTFTYCGSSIKSDRSSAVALASR